jgi:hypothetical protein
LEDESADTVNNVINGTKANSAAGTDELLAVNKLKKVTLVTSLHLLLVTIQSQ